MESRSGQPSLRITRRQLFVVGAGALGAIAFGLRGSAGALDERQARMQTPEVLHRTGDRSCQCPVCQPRSMDTGLA